MAQSCQRSFVKTFASVRKAARRDGVPLRFAGAENHVGRAQIREILHGPRLQPKLTVGPPDDAYGRVFGTGYTPGTSTAMRLLAHKLTHVNQQQRSRTLSLKPKDDSDSPFLDPAPEQSARIPRWIFEVPEEETTPPLPEEESTIARKESPISGPALPEKTIGNQHRQEIAQVLHRKRVDGELHRAVSGPATGSCSWTCPPAGAPPYVAVSDPSHNCYAYAMTSPGSGFLQPGQIANTIEFRATSGDAAAISSLGGPPAAAAHLQSNYFSPAGVQTQFQADLGSRFSPNCVNCCSSSKRKVVAVTTDALSAVGGTHWDFHWYRKDSDKGWSHKRGELDSQRDDAASAGPICSPCGASRSYPGLNYSNVVGAWCL